MGQQPGYDEEEEEDDAIPLDDFVEGPDLGPDERDRDLMDGTWERDYYGGKLKSVNWNAIVVAVSLLILAGLIVPLVFGVSN